MTHSLPLLYAGQVIGQAQVSDSVLPTLKLSWLLRVPYSIRTLCDNSIYSILVHLREDPTKLPLCHPITHLRGESGRHPFRLSNTVLDPRLTPLLQEYTHARPIDQPTVTAVILQIVQDLPRVHFLDANRTNCTVENVLPLGPKNLKGNTP